MSHPNPLHKTAFEIACRELSKIIFRLNLELKICKSSNRQNQMEILADQLRTNGVLVEEKAVQDAIKYADTIPEDYEFTVLRILYRDFPFCITMSLEKDPDTESFTGITIDPIDSWENAISTDEADQLFSVMVGGVGDTFPKSDQDELRAMWEFFHWPAGELQDAEIHLRSEDSGDAVYLYYDGKPRAGWRVEGEEGEELVRFL